MLVTTYRSVERPEKRQAITSLSEKKCRVSMKPVIFTIDKSIFQQLEIRTIQSTDYRDTDRTIEPLDFNAYESQTLFRLIKFIKKSSV